MSDICSIASSNYTNKGSETVKYNKAWSTNTYLLFASGSIAKDKSAAKDGDDWYFYVKNKNIKLYANNQTLNPLLGTDKKNHEGQDLSNGKTVFVVEKDGEPAA